MAERLHGVSFSWEKPHGYGEPVSYSVDADQSIVAVLGVTASGFGALANGLFRLMAHRHFEDIPVWLEEGMAALYDTAGDRCRRPNVREAILRRSSHRVPALAELLRMRVDEFHNYGREDPDIEARYALAYCFMLYLQDRGKLPHTYRSLQSQNLGNMGADRGWDAIQVIEDILEMQIAQVQMSFDDWFWAR